MTSYLVPNQYFKASHHCVSYYFTQPTVGDHVVVCYLVLRFWGTDASMSQNERWWVGNPIITCICSWSELSSIASGLCLTVITWWASKLRELPRHTPSARNCEFLRLAVVSIIVSHCLYNLPPLRSLRHCKYAALHLSFILRTSSIISRSNLNQVTVTYWSDSHYAIPRTALEDWEISYCQICVLWCPFNVPRHVKGSIGCVLCCLSY